MAEWEALAEIDEDGRPRSGSFSGFYSDWRWLQERIICCSSSSVLRIFQLDLVALLFSKSFLFCSTKQSLRVFAPNIQGLLERLIPVCIVELKTHSSTSQLSCFHSATKNQQNLSHHYASCKISTWVVCFWFKRILCFLCFFFGIPSFTFWGCVYTESGVLVKSQDCAFISSEALLVFPATEEVEIKQLALNHVFSSLTGAAWRHTVLVCSYSETPTAAQRL